MRKETNVTCMTHKNVIILSYSIEVILLLINSKTKKNAANHSVNKVDKY